MTLPRGYRLGLVAVLLISLALRMVLVHAGGQYFWADETRYGAAEKAWSEWEAGRRVSAVSAVMGTADHLGFKVLMLGPAWVQEHVDSDLRTPAYFISLFSLANILWIWLIARRTGAGEREAFWAAAAMACANSMFYWSRHLMPYDVALFWALACAWVAFRPEARFRHSLLAGFLGFAAFVTYNGYWLIVGMVLTAHVLLEWPNWRKMIPRAAFGLLGLAGSFYLLLEAGLRIGSYLLQSYLDFAGSIDQGDFNQGHRVFFDYIWRTELGTAVVWLSVLAAAPFLLRRCSQPERLRGAMWVAGILGTASILIVGSNVFDRFVVYGRLARQAVPFCALLVGWTAGRLLAGRPRAVEIAALTVVFACGAVSMSVPLRQEFPNAFYLRARAKIDEVQRLRVAAGQAPLAADRFRILYAGFIWPYPDENPLPASFQVLLSSAHPLAWRPYLYEGFNSDQRSRIEATDIEMRLVLLKD